MFAPAATGLVSVYAKATEQGTILGAAQAIAGLGRTVGPPLIGTIHDVVSPVTSFALAGLIMVIAGLGAFGLAPVTPPPPSGS